MNCVLVSDLHGSDTRYRRLFELIGDESPDAVFIGGDLLPGGFGLAAETPDLVGDILVPNLTALKSKLGSTYPRIFLILGNDDPRVMEEEIREAEAARLWEYVSNKLVKLGEYDVYGYAFVPPTPFQLKDWERYDVSRFVDPACVSPEEGFRSVPLPNGRAKYRTIADDLQSLTGDRDLSKAIFLFHSPPYKTKLDRAALDGKMIDHVPLDVHVGSIAMRRMIETRQPLLTLHGHIHESTRLTGYWRDRIGATEMFNAAHDGEELAVIRFDPARLDEARRELL